VAIVGLLGGLAVYDALNRPTAPELPKMAAKPAELVEPVAKAVEEKPAEEKAAEEKPAEVAAEPERTETPLASASAEKFIKPAKPLTLPATARTASIKPPPPLAVPIKPDAQREIARAVPEGARVAPVTHAQAQHAPASRPLTQMTEAARHFLVQVGVFSNPANAEELVTKLHEAGIPAQIESRVQVGPFASRAEADAARAKLKAMGLDDGLLVRR